jgi:predicted dehydrogenase
MKVREILQSGKLGCILLIRIAWHRFRRRWDWQTLKEFGGGNLNNEGAHLVDMGLLLLNDAEPRVLAYMGKTDLSSGDAENHVKIVLHAPGYPVVDLEMTDNCAYPQSTWIVMGSQGGLVGTRSHLEWKYIDFHELDARPNSREPTPDRTYNSEQLKWHNESCDFDEDGCAVSMLRLYEDLYRAIRITGKSSISLESLRKQVKVIEECRHQAE